MQPTKALQSVAYGIYALAGSRYESPAQAGVAHCLEHMFFKGTSRRDTFQIAVETNALGSHINAYTSQEMICLHGRVIGEKLEHLTDLLNDMLMDPLLDSEELDRERNVIIEEVMMYEDTPDERVADLFTEALWGDHPLGRPILGSRESLGAMTAGQLRDYLDAHGTPDRLVLALAGDFDPDGAKAMLERQLGAYRPDVRSALERLPSVDNPPPTVHGNRTIEKPLEQIHFCLGSTAVHRGADDRFALLALNLVLGGGMSSRLFQEVREKRGLAYSIGSYLQGFVDTGFFAIYGSATPPHFEETLDICRRETRRIYEEDIPEAEVENAKDMMRQSLLLCQDNTDARMARMAEQLIYHGRPIPLEETLAIIQSLTANDLRASAEKYIQNKKTACATIGPEGTSQVIERLFL